VQLATAEYRNAEDVVGLFIEECCLPGDPGTRTAAKDLYASYRMWADARGERALSMTTFGEELRRHGAERVVVHGLTYYKTLRLTPRAA
jgi:phage/plasmid-associated DNA primase